MLLIAALLQNMGSDDIENWHNKINPAVVLKSINRSPPSFDETISGKTAVLIDEDNGNIEHYCLPEWCKVESCRS